MPSDDSAPHPLGYYRDAFAVCLQKSCATRAKSHASICGQTRKPSGSSIRSGYRPTKSCSIGSATCSSAQSEPSNEVRRFHANFTYQARSWTKPRRVIAKVEWHPGELYPRVGFIVTNLSRPAERVVAFYNKRGTCEQWIKEGKGAIKWTRLSCRTFAANAVRLQLHALAYNLGNFLRTLATPEPIKDWSLTSLKEKLIKTGAKVVSHGRYVVFQMAEVAIPRQMFKEILRLIAELRPQPPPAPVLMLPRTSGRAFAISLRSTMDESCCPTAWRSLKYGSSLGRKRRPRQNSFTA